MDSMADLGAHATAVIGQLHAHLGCAGRDRLGGINAIGVDVAGPGELDQWLVRVVYSVGVERQRLAGRSPEAATATVAVKFLLQLSALRIPTGVGWFRSTFGGSWPGVRFAPTSCSFEERGGHV
jgi:hypothetical protein